MFKKFVLPGLAILLAALCAFYIADTIVARIRLAISPKRALGTVDVYYGAALKGDKFSIFGGQPDKVTCVHAVFGHFGYPSCWYAEKQSVEID